MMFKTRSEKKFDRLENEGLRWCYGKKGGSAPPPPDYTSAAIASGEASKEVTEQQTWANRPDQFTPWGSTTWQNQQVWDPSTEQYLNRWAQSTQLTPDAQEALDAQLDLQNKRSQLGGSLYDRMESEYSNPMDWNNAVGWGGLLQGGEEARNRAEDALYSRATSRLDPQWEQGQSDMEAKLAAQGLRPGDPAYDRQMENFNRAKTDAYNQAQYSAITGGGQEATRQQGMDQQASAYQNTLRQAQLAEQMQQRGFTLNEINALLTNQQVGMPQMPTFNQANAAQATDYLGAANMGYNAQLDAFNAQQAGNQGFMSGLMGLGGSLGSAMIMSSDRRLKKNIKKIGEYLGLNVYSWTYLWGAKAVGFMADEVKKVIPEAVVTHPSGYDMVDYGKILKEV